MNQEYKLYRISQLLSRFREQVKILNSNGEFSINLHAENILIDLLNEVYNLELTNVNYEEGKNYPSIDLRDLKNRVAIQVTSTADFEKIKQTLTKFIKNDLQKDINKVYIFIITEKHTKYDQIKIDKLLNGKFKFSVEDILDRTDIYKELNRQNNLSKIDAVSNLLEKQFADDKVKLDKWDSYCKGLNEYDSYVCNLFKFLDIKGFSPKINNTLVKLDLDKVYVPLELKIQEESSKGQLKERRTREYSIGAALYYFDKLVVLGDPGSGKSTTLKHLAYQICASRMSDSQFTNLVPIIIKGSEFAKYVSNSSKGLGEYIIDHIEKKYENLFVEKLESNDLLVLIDGIDEINQTKLRHDVVDRINAFIAQYPDLKIVVSSRIVGYKETRLNGFFNHFQVVKFNEDQIKEFVQNWYLSIASGSDKDIELARVRATELFNSIRRNESVLKMASNPLLVTIIALIHFQGSTLPERRATLYDIATSTFLENWVKLRATNSKSNFDKEALIEILAPISFFIHENYSTGLISETELKSQLLKEYKGINPYLNSKEQKKDVKDILDFLREDAGFLFEKGINENGESIFGFVHQTFQEYFTAIEFKTRWKENAFKNNLNEFIFNTNWREVIKLTASLFKTSEQTRLGRQYASDFICDILEVEDPFPEFLRPLNIVLQILNEDTDIDFKVFIQIIDRIINDIFENDEQSYDTDNSYNKEVTVFKLLFSKLLDTKTYQRYLVDRLLLELKKSEISENLKTNLMYVLIGKSENEIIQKELIKILKSDNSALKVILFNYNVIIPMAPIVCTKVFRDEVVNYVNSDLFLSKYEGHLPTQYQISFEKLGSGYFGRFTQGEPIEEIAQEILEDKLLSIRFVNSEEMKVELINDYVFSIGFDNVEGTKKFISEIEKEYEGLSIKRVHDHIDKLEKFNSYNLAEHELFELEGTKIYISNTSDTTYAFVKKDKNPQFVDYPFTENELEPFFGEMSIFLINYFAILIPTLIEGKNYPKIDELNELLRFVKCHKSIGWFYDYRFDLSEIYEFAFENLILNKKVNIDLWKWLSKEDRIREKRFELSDQFSKTDFFENMRSSELECYEQLYLIYLLGEKSDYEDLIRPTIERLSDDIDTSQKEEIKRVLYDVLE